MLSKPNTKGKRRIIKAISTDTSDLNIDRYQQIVKRANNCKASSWKCSSCHVPTINKCYAKARKALENMAFLKYRDRPEYKKEQEKIEKEKTIKKIIDRM